MLFSSVTFLYYFLPIVLAAYFLVPRRFKNLVLLVSSVFFYAWGEPLYVFVMLGSTLSGYLFGLLIEKFRGTLGSKLAMIGSVVVGVGALGLFKYSDFFIENINAVFHSAIPLLKLALPLGISFYTFQILSYTIDLYWGKAQVQRSFLTFATYVMLFPQLIAGPIVRYTTVARELESRTHSLQNFTAGATRFVMGLAKKVLLANTFGELVAIFKSSDENSVLFVWIYCIAYSFHVYFDFSGYSDMAIGLGRIFGFHFLENFNYPYVATSATEFWRRWHISMGSWFRDYIYIPLGGNRVGIPRHILNIMIVWFVTGFWHGAGWNFIIWGLYFGVLLLIEKFVLLKVLEKIPKVFSWLYLMLALFISWAFFDAANIGTSFQWIGRMFGAGVSSLAGVESLYYLRSYALLAVIAVIACTPWPRRLVARISATPAGGRVMTVVEPLAIAALLVVITAYLVDGSFNPFIYFRF